MRDPNGCVLTFGKPQVNAPHERMHRTLKAGVCRPVRGTFSAQQRAVNEFRRNYN